MRSLSGSHRFIASCLAVLLFLTNVLFLHAGETNVWKERQKAVLLANPSTQMANLTGVPPLSNGYSQFSLKLENRFKDFGQRTKDQGLRTLLQ